MKKLILAVALLLLIVAPAITYAQAGAGFCGPIVPPCNPCGLTHFFILLGNIYKFVVQCIAIPLAILAITIGGIMMLVSAGNPGLAGTGKKALFYAIIGLLLALGSDLIINFILKALGATQNFVAP